MENLDRRSALQVDCGEILSNEFDFTAPPLTDYAQGGIDEDAWPAHREHGDRLGPCGE